MADRKGKRLTQGMLSATLAPGNYHDNARTGLILRVTKAGSRQWVQRLTVNGKRVEIGLGSPPKIGLAKAREDAFNNASAAARGEDPLAAKKAARKAAREARDALTFAQAVEQCLAARLSEFRNEKHKAQWSATLTTYAVPRLGPRPVAEIETADVLAVLQPIWAEKNETASRLRGRIEKVLDWAAVAGHRRGENPARWKGNLAELLPKPAAVQRDKGGNQPAVAVADLPRWWKALAAREGMAALALRFAVLTAARSGEVRGMTWEEIEGLPGDQTDRTDETPAQGAVWHIPATRMKAGRAHSVPLPAAAVEILRALPRMEGSGFVFFAPRGGRLSDMTLSAVMRRMQEGEAKAGRPGWLDPRSKRPAVPHGLRSSFRDWCAERGVDRDLAELALAHVVGSETERAYRRTDLIERRRALLEDWAAYLEG